MDLTNKISKYENIHIAFWLVKDTCWMLEIKWLGTFMMIPTLFFALFIVYKTMKEPAGWINAAVFFWILANSYWMLIEFYNNNHYKELAALPFGLGLLCTLMFVIKSSRLKKKSDSSANQL